MRLPLTILALAAAPAFAQEDEKYFLVRQACDPLELVLETIENKYQEQPLFTGTGTVVHISGQPFTGGSMFFVNQDTGTWTLATLYADGTACLTAFGADFAPYVD